MLNFLTGFRKWTLAVVYLSVAITLLAIGLIPPQDWLAEVTKVVVAFMGTNVGEHLIQFGKEWLKNNEVFKRAK